VLKNVLTPFRSLLIVFALVLAACGSETTTETAATSDEAADTTAGTDADAQAPNVPLTGEPSAVEVVAGSTDQINGGKPTEILPSGDAPPALETLDIIDGDGVEAQPGDLLAMHYVGVLHADGSEFDASWDRGDTFGFTLGQGRVIQGWDEGIVGMQVGGRRILTIPAEQAYGAQSPSPAIPANSPLVFVVDLVDIISVPEVENAPAPVTDLDVTVLEEGDGEVVEVGDIIDLHFVAIVQQTGEEIGSTFIQGQPALLEVGAEPSQIIEAFDIAIPGNTVGTWLRLVIPPELGLPAEAAGELPEDPTLVVELLISAIN